MPEPKDVIVGILGASGALAGLLLVFSGFVFAQAAAFPEETSDKVIERYRKAGRLAIYPFWGFLVTTLLSLAWLLHPHRAFTGSASHCSPSSFWEREFMEPLHRIVTYDLAEAKTMGLTQKVRLLLESKGFQQLYADHMGVWTALAEDAKALMGQQIPNREPTVDDIKLLLLPILELNDNFRTFMADHPRLTQQFWSEYFTDYVLDRVYDPQLRQLPPPAQQLRQLPPPAQTLQGNH